MLRERPFDIYTGQEDVFGPGYFFSRHNPVFLFLYNTLLILPKDNTKRTIAFKLSLIFFSEKRQIYLNFSFHYFFSEKLPHLPIKTKWSLPDLCVVQFRPCCQVKIRSLGLNTLGTT